jgi:protein TonB
VKDEGLLNTPPVVDKGTGIVETKPVEDENKVFEKVEIEASVNPSTWRRHLESQLQRYIEDAASAGMNPGTYTVNVRFLVERDGSITDVRALNDPGYGLGAGAAEVVKRGPKWNPGEQNGRKVRSYHTQPITFVIQEQ